jgi:hypothetical protein
MPTKNKFFPSFPQVFCLLHTKGKGTVKSVFNDKKLSRSHKTIEIKVFLMFLLADGRIRIRTNNYGTGKPKNGSGTLIS